MAFIPAKKQLVSGFTLIELLIVIAILGVLAAVVLIAVNPLQRQQQARDAIRKSDLGNLASAFATYYVDNGTYPVTNCIGALGACGNNDADGTWLRNPYPPLLVPDYIKVLPSDPQHKNGANCFPYTSGCFEYGYVPVCGYWSSGTPGVGTPIATDYVLMARFEKASDPAGGNTVNTSCGSFTAPAGVIYISH